MTRFDQIISNTLAIEKGLKFYGNQIVSAGLVVEIPPEVTAYRLLAFFENEEDARELEFLIEQF